MQDDIGGQVSQGEDIWDVDWFQVLWGERESEMWSSRKKLIFRNFTGVVFESTCEGF